MAPLFSAYDRPCYQKLVPSHIADVESYDDQIIKCFRAGGFTVKVKGGMGHAVALDEAHEMCVNLDMKMAIVRPTQPYLKKMNFFFSYRIKAQTQLASQLFPATTEPTQKSKLFDTTTFTKHWDENIMKMHSLINQHKMFTIDTDSNRGIVNVFTGTVEQTHDLLNARSMEEHTIRTVTHHILQVPP